MTEIRMESQSATYNKDDDVDILLDLLREKFQLVPEERELQIRDASVKQVEYWSLRTLSEPDIDTVFETRSSPSPQSEPDWEYLRQTGLDMGTLAAGYYMNGLRNYRLISKLHGEKRDAVDLLLTMLSARFWRSPKGREQQILDASVEQVKAWSRRVLSAPDVDAVFKTGCASYPQRPPYGKGEEEANRMLGGFAQLMYMDGMKTGMLFNKKHDKGRSVVDMFLEVLFEKFQKVPKERERQIRTASLEQIKEWCLPLVFATDIDEVFEESKDD